jgi:SAM-dependent methyltransferase
MQHRPYEGEELELFAEARHWKSYWEEKVRPYVGRSVLEVGAGLGANTPYLLGPNQERWVCLEPDAVLAKRIPRRIEDHPQRGVVEVRTGFLAQYLAGESFDTILYIDVMEHVEDDRLEMKLALERLKPGGKLIVLSPAYPWLFSEFDRALGHYRRYTRASMQACAPEDARLVEMMSLDFFGLFATMLNRFVLHQSLANATQVHFWDRVLVPMSRWVDPVTRFSVGKSLVGIWEREGP